MNKKPAFIAAFLTTAVIAVAMLMIGVSAFTNPNTVPVASSPAAAAPDTSVSLNTGSDQFNQLQALVAQYQARELQYQSQQTQLQSELNQANAQIQQFNQIMTALQQRRIITIDKNGQISISRRSDN
jgi:hypothetical protein